MQRPGSVDFRTIVLVRDAWRASHDGEEAIKARQTERLRSLVAFARANSRFYREHYRGLPRSISDIRQLPAVTKRELMARFDDWVTDPEITKAGVDAFVADPANIGGQFLGRYTVWMTSGSTGTPAILLQDERAIAVMAALGMARAVPSWIGRAEVRALVGRGVRGALVFATGGHFMALSMAERARRQNAWFRSFGEIISVTTPVSEIVARLNELDPTILASYASGHLLLAEEQAAGRLKIDPVLLISTGESLPPANRQRVEAVFGQRVRETYGASEIQIAAFECHRGRLHVNADWVILEPVDENYQPVPPGEPSRTVLATSLSNRVQPIIRYDLADRITVFPDPCPCGSPLPSIRVEGRTDEILAFRSAAGETVHVMPTALMAVVAEIPGLLRFQLIGKGLERLVMRFEVEPGRDKDQVWATVEDALRGMFDANGLANVRIERSLEGPSPISRSGKLRQVWSEPG
jgi:phenylacetate-coenzyme A ligase PaaK-like adenylate-forming protein